MIAIVDGGSTKCAWGILDNSLEIIVETQTSGLNGYLTNQLNLEQELNKNKDIGAFKDKLSHIYFYNTGCGTSESQIRFSTYLKAYFPNTEIVVGGDLLGSAYALYDGRPFIAGILGTGSNSCYFDGKSIHKPIPSLGYILGDEGGGVSLGKRVLKSYYYNQMPSELCARLENDFDMNLDKVLSQVYSKPNPNAFIGDFGKFLTENKDHVFCKDLVYEEISLFFETQIDPYKKFNTSVVSLVGSITHYFQDEIRMVAEEHGLKIGKLIKSPVHELINYHKKFIINK